MKAVIYARYSEGPRQTDQSIEGQVADCKAFAAQKGLDVIGLYADRHVSGKSIEGRDEFQRMIRDAEKGKFDAIIVWKVDRFGRSREDIAVNKIRLRKAGVTLMYARESIPDGPEGILLESLMEGLAEYYSADLRQKIIRGQKESAKKGRFPAGKLPIGYRRGGDGKIEPDPDRAPVIRKLFELQAQGATLSEEQQLLERYGIPSAKSSIWRIVRNEKYLGRFEIHGIMVPAEAIVSEELFRKASGHYGVSRRRSKMRYLLSCKCHCGKCGKILQGMTGTGKLGKKYHYYRCPDGCIPAIGKDELEDLVVDVARREILTDDMIGQITRRVMEIQTAQLSGGDAALLEKKLADLRRRQSNVAKAIEEGAPGMVERLQEITREIGEVDVELSKAKLSVEIIPEELIRAWLVSFREGDASDPDVRRRLLDTFVQDVIVDVDDVNIFFNSRDSKGVRVPSHEAHYRDLREHSPTILGDVIIVRVKRKKAPQH